MLAAQGGHFPRHATGLKAVNAAAEGDGVLILAQDYPAKTTTLGDEVLAIAERKNLPFLSPDGVGSEHPHSELITP